MRCGAKRAGQVGGRPARSADGVGGNELWRARPARVESPPPCFDPTPSPRPRHRPASLAPTSVLALVERPSRLAVDQSVFVRADDRLEPRMRPKLADQALDVRSHRVHADAELLGDGAVLEASRHEPEDLALA